MRKEKSTLHCCSGLCQLSDWKSSLTLIESSVGGAEGGRSFPNENLGVQLPPCPRFGTEKHFYRRIWQYLSDISDFRTHIFCLAQMTQELPKEHNEAGPPEQLPSDTLSQIDYGHTRHCEDCKEVCLCQRTTQRAFWKFWIRGMRIAE